MSFKLIFANETVATVCLFSSLLYQEIQSNTVKEEKSFNDPTNEYTAGFSFSTHPLANASVITDRQVETVGHSPSLTSGIFIYRNNPNI